MRSPSPTRAAELVAAAIGAQAAPHAGDAFLLSDLSRGPDGALCAPPSYRIAGKLCLPPLLREIRDAWVARHPDVPSGPKLAYRGTHFVTAPGRFEVQLALTSFRDVFPIHRHLRGVAPEALAELALGALGSESTTLPTSLSVHGLLFTRDDQLVLARRSAGAGYHPRHWSVSFEEGCEPDEFDPEHGPERTYVRGLLEEFGVTHTHVTATAVHEVLLEAGLLNPAFLVSGRIDLSADELRARWASHGAHDENDRLAFVAADAVQCRSISARPHFTTPDGESNPWHPTACYRLMRAAELLARA